MNAFRSNLDLQSNIAWNEPMLSSYLSATEMLSDLHMHTSAKKNLTRTTPHEPLRILIADDAKLVADTLGEILCRSGFLVSVVYSGKKALERAPDFLPDCLIADTLGSEMSGIELVVQMKKHYPMIQIVFGLTDLLYQLDC
ncbi:MAG: response regulator [Acidobacteriaceae bacterium]|nr:response regulator [Acidobacteriaceae bacterium]